MKFPLVLLVGQAGTGKDTAASFLEARAGAVILSLADPLKALASYLFDFSDTQLWGESKYRNEIDTRYVGGNSPAWQAVFRKINNFDELSVILKRFIPKEQLSESVGSALYYWAQALLQTHGNNITPRTVLQSLGTEHFRNTMGEDTWINCGITTANQLLTGRFTYNRKSGLISKGEVTSYHPSMVVIPDGRFVNEVLAVTRNNGWVVQMFSPQKDEAATERAGLKMHSSEQEQKLIPWNRFDVIVINDKGEGLGPLGLKMENLSQMIMTYPKFL